MKPLHDRVLVKGTVKDTTTASGIIMTGSIEKPSEGLIIAVGGKVTEVKVGESVLFETAGSSEVKVNDENLLVMKEEKIIGIL